MSSIAQSGDASALLGKKVSYPQVYCPEILVAVPRSLNRDMYGIDRPGELFCGYDSWHAYEASFLLENGMPMVGVLKMVYPANSPCIVESKSLKLYLGSYHMTSMGREPEEAIERFVQTVQTDLSKLLTTEVKVCFYKEQREGESHFDFEGYQILEEQVRPDAIRFTVYQEHPAYLSENIIQQGGEIKVCSHLLKSNCKITNQPDWGSIYIHLKGETLPDEHSLLKYIVSLRNENHFHEEICEMTYKRLSDIFQPEVLMVCCLYTRRGGIDICPCRANAPQHLPTYLPLANALTQRSFRQ